MFCSRRHRRADTAAVAVVLDDLVPRFSSLFSGTIRRILRDEFLKYIVQDVLFGTGGSTASRADRFARTLVSPLFLMRVFGDPSRFQSGTAVGRDFTAALGLLSFEYVFFIGSTTRTTQIYAVHFYDDDDDRHRKRVRPLNFRHHATAARQPI